METLKFKNKKDLKIIFVGIPDMALVCLSNLIEKGFNIAAVVPPKKSHETFNFFKEFCRIRDLNFLEYGENPNDPKLIEKINDLKADIGVVCSFNSKLSKEFLATTKLGYINSHPSKLPLYRGACPYFHIVNNGEIESGITLHFMDETFDTGDIVCQKLFNLSPNETMGTIFNKTTYMISDSIIETLERLLKQGFLETKKQEAGTFIDAPKVGGNFRIRWNQEAKVIERLIRACNPFYTAFAVFRGVSAKIIKAQAVEKKHNFECGHIVEASKDKLSVACIDSVLNIEFLSIGTWGYFSTSDFFETFMPGVDEVFL